MHSIIGFGSPLHSRLVRPLAPESWHVYILTRIHFLLHTLRCTQFDFSGSVWPRYCCCNTPFFCSVSAHIQTQFLFHILRYTQFDFNGSVWPCYCCWNFRVFLLFCIRTFTNTFTNAFRFVCVWFNTGHILFLRSVWLHSSKQ